MSVLGHLEPKKVFEIFEQMCAIPHGSGNMKAISDFCVRYATERGYKAVQDEFYNVVIYKDATPGYENLPTVIIQGHLDMVCEQDTSVSKIDMATEGLELGIDGDEIYAKGTTLGGDDGIAVAFALALLDDKEVQHPRLELLLTIDEEVGMIGAENLDASMLDGRILINIDSEEEGTFLSSCAGGMRCQAILPVQRENIEGQEMKVEICGLRGGHSGMEIIKQRGNSNGLMARALNKVNRETPIHLVALEGGLKDNAIPLDTKAIIITDNSQTVQDILRDLEISLKNEFRTVDPEVMIKVEVGTMGSYYALDRTSTDKVIALGLSLPNGIQRMSSDMEGLVQTSLNMGILRLDEESCMFSYSVRSSVESEKYALVEKIKTLTESLGGTCNTHGDYPGWEYVADSRLRRVALDSYRNLYNEEAKVEAIHAGLECGLLSGKLPGLDAISFGPNMKDVHTSKERLSISSSARTYELLVEILKNMKEY